MPPRRKYIRNLVAAGRKAAQERRNRRLGLTNEATASPVNQLATPIPPTLYSGDLICPLTRVPITNANTGGQPNRNQRTSNTLHCLLCSTETTQNLASLINCADKEADFLVMFLLKKMLGVANKNLTEYLSTLGHPRDWVSICDACSPLVIGAFAVQKQIGELEVKLRVFQKKMKETIKSRNLETQKKFQTGGAIPPGAAVPKSNPAVSNEETKDIVASGMEGIIKGDSHATCQVKTTTSVLSEEKNFPEDSDMECDGRDYDDFNNSSKMRNVSTKEFAELEPSYELSNPTTRKKRKQTLTERREELTKKHIISSDVKSNALEEQADMHGVGGSTKVSVVSKLTKKRGRPKKEVVYRCAMCPNLKSMRLRSFVMHLVYHSDRPYKCSECSAYCTGDDMELTQLASENQSGGHVCRRETLVKVKLETGKIWDCSHCSEAFKLESERDLHETNAHANKVPMSSLYNSSTCSRCPKKFRDYPEWQIHRALEHPDLAKLGCFYCDEIFKYKLKEAVDVVDITTRNKHIKEHHGWNYTIKDELLACRTCGAIFKTSDKLKHHVQTEHGNNSDDKLYWCPVCYKSGSCWRKALRHIQRSHFEKPRGERLICDLCAYGTLTASVLVEHRFLEHGIEPENKKTKIYSCTSEGCSFKCIMKGTFDRHMMKEHNAERRFKCRICGRGFLATGHRKEHERTHATAKPFQCEICGNSFAVKNYLYIHMRLSHQNRPFASTNRKRTPRKPVVQNPVKNPTSHLPFNSSLPDCIDRQAE